MATRNRLAKNVKDNPRLAGDGSPHPRPARVPERKVELDAAHCWLERTNPVSGLSIRTAQSIFDAARAGDTQRLHWLFHEIESSNPILFTCIERRQSAVAGFQLKVSALPSMDGSLADEQKDAVETFIAGIENFTELLEHLETAFFRGFALAQPIWEADGSVREIALHNSWEFLVHEGALYHNPECDGWSRHCVPCADAGLIGIQRRRAIDYPALSVHVRHAVSERDWGRFLERYALPKPAVTMAPNATNEQRNDYLVAARAVENGQVSVWPNGTNITDFAGGSRGTDPFNSFIEHQEKLIVLLATGGTLTSLAQADTGSLAGGAQMKVWQEIVRRDAGVLAQAVKRSLLKPYLERTFGARPCAVDFALDFPEERSAQDAANVAATLRQAGWRVDQGELEKAVGFTLEREESAPGPQAFARAKAASPAQASALQGAFSAGFEEAMAAAMAKAMVEELEHAKADVATAAAEDREANGEFAPKGTGDKTGGKKDAGKKDGEGGEEETAGTYTAEHRAKIGQTGDWKSLGLPAMRDITPDPPIVFNKEAEARARIMRGETVTNPFGDVLHIDQRSMGHIGKKKRSPKQLSDKLRSLDGARETVEHPHEIWLGDNGRRLYVRITAESNGRRVVNAVEQSPDLLLSWHTSPESYDHYRHGVLQWLRK